MNQMFHDHELIGNQNHLESQRLADYYGKVHIIDVQRHAILASKVSTSLLWQTTLLFPMICFG